MSSRNRDEVPRSSYPKTVFALGLIVLAVMVWKAIPEAKAGPLGGNSTVCPQLQQASDPALMADSIYRRWVAAGESPRQAAKDLENSVNEYCPAMWSQLGEADWQGGLSGRA